MDLKISNEEIKNYLRYRNIIPNASAVIFRKSAILDINLPLTMNYCGDWYLWIELLKKGDIAYKKEALNFFRKHDKTTRMIKVFDMEYKRFNEFFYIVLKNSTLIDRLFNFKKYDWILIEWYLKKPSFNKRTNFKLNMPLEFLLRSYIINYKKLI